MDFVKKSLLLNLFFTPMAFASQQKVTCTYDAIGEHDALNVIYDETWIKVIVQDPKGEFYDVLPCEKEDVTGSMICKINVFKLSDAKMDIIFTREMNGSSKLDYVLWEGPVDVGDSDTLTVNHYICPNT